jgi:uncharacterized repeat protein (TIGR02543 family)
VVIPDGVTTIAHHAFDQYGQLASLTSITIPASVSIIENHVFHYATSLASITFAEGSQLTSIGEAAFAFTSLTSITIPASVTSIGNYAFYGAFSLKDLYFIGNAPTYVGEYAFYGTAFGAKAHIKSGATGFGSDGQTWNGLNVATGVYSATYDTAGGTAVTSGTFIQGDTIQTAPVSTRPGYTLAGWSETATGSVVTFPYSPTATADITLHAIWTLNNGRFK